MPPLRARLKVAIIRVAGTTAWSLYFLGKDGQHQARDGRKRHCNVLEAVTFIGGEAPRRFSFVHDSDAARFRSPECALACGSAWWLQIRK